MIAVLPSGRKRNIDVKARIECHVMKTYVSLDQEPFYCSLCLFCCSDKATLLEHVTTCKRHEVMAKMQGVAGNTDCLNENPTAATKMLRSPLFLSVLLFCSACGSVCTVNMPVQGSLFDSGSLNSSLNLSVQQYTTVN